jgi:ATP-binding cassette subfamily G (WHITE) protein 2 (SNQ2)
MVNEFRTRTLVCRLSDMVPNGPAYTDIAYQACTVMGATPGSFSVPGMDFIGAVYGFTSSHVWRNIGILWAMCVIYVILILVGASLLVRERPGSSGKTYIRQRRSVKPGIKHVETQNIDSDQVVNEKDISLQTAPVYTFRDITYSVQVNDQEKVLLVSGI